MLLLLQIGLGIWIPAGLAIFLSIALEFDYDEFNDIRLYKRAILIFFGGPIIWLVWASIFIHGYIISWLTR